MGFSETILFRKEEGLTESDVPLVTSYLSPLTPVQIPPVKDEIPSLPQQIASGNEERKKAWKENTIIVNLLGRDIPFIYPKISDPRLIQIGILTTVNTLGQVLFHFHINLIQICLVVFTSITLDVLLTYFSKKIILFPASGFISGLSMAFLIETYPGPLSYIIYVIAGILAICSKQFITYREKHIFNPSNIAIVYLLLAFPQIVYITPEEWKASLFLIIPIILIGLRLIKKARVITVASTFILVETLLFILHGAVAGISFSEIIGGLKTHLFSPAILIFTLFMITDPRTAPKSRVGKILYSTILGAFHWIFLTLHFGTISLFLPLFFACMAVPFVEQYFAVFDIYIEKYISSFSLPKLSFKFLQSFLPYK